VLGYASTLGVVVRNIHHVPTAECSSKQQRIVTPQRMTINYSCRDRMLPWKDCTITRSPGFHARSVTARTPCKLTFQ